MSLTQANLVTKDFMVELFDIPSWTVLNEVPSQQPGFCIYALNPWLNADYPSWCLPPGGWTFAEVVNLGKYLRLIFGAISPLEFDQSWLGMCIDKVASFLTDMALLAKHWDTNRGQFSIQWALAVQQLLRLVQQYYMFIQMDLEGYSQLLVSYSQMNGQEAQTVLACCYTNGFHNKLVPSPTLLHQWRDRIKEVFQQRMDLVFTHIVHLKY